MPIPEILEALAFYETLESELSAQTDRSLGILSFSFLDSLVSALLENWFVEAADRKRLFGANGPLATASARIVLAHAAGLISDDERRDLDLLRKIRNKLAHEYAPVSFDDDPHKSLCLELALGERLYVPKDIPLYRAPDGKHYVVTDFDAVPDLPLVSVELPNADRPRERYAATVGALIRVLGARWMRASSMSPTSPAEFEYGEGPYALMVIDVERVDAEIQAVHARYRTVESKADALGDDETVVEAQIQQRQLAASHALLANWIAVARYGNEVMRRSRATT